MDHYTRAYHVYSRIRGFYSGKFQDMLCSLRRFDRSEGAQQRIKIIRFYEVYPLTIKSWQSGNGKENLGEFDEELKREEITHYFSYPHCPKIKTYIERYNRTIQEEFIDNNLDIIYDKPLFHKRLAEYLIFYNTERPHPPVPKAERPACATADRPACAEGRQVNL